MARFAVVVAVVAFAASAAANVPNYGRTNPYGGHTPLEMVEVPEDGELRYFKFNPSVGKYQQVATVTGSGRVIVDSQSAAAQQWKQAGDEGGKQYSGSNYGSENALNGKLKVKSKSDESGSAYSNRVENGNEDYYQRNSVRFNEQGDYAGHGPAYAEYGYQPSGAAYYGNAGGRYDAAIVQESGVYGNKNWRDQSNAQNQWTNSDSTDFDGDLSNVDYANGYNSADQYYNNNWLNNGQAAKATYGRADDQYKYNYQPPKY